MIATLSLRAFRSLPAPDRAHAVYAAYNDAHGGKGVPFSYWWRDKLCRVCRMDTWRNKRGFKVCSKRCDEHLRRNMRRWIRRWERFLDQEHAAEKAA